MSAWVVTAIYSVLKYCIPRWSLIPTIREEYRLREFENSVLRRKFGPKRDEVQDNGGSCTVRSFIFCTQLQILLGRSRQEEWGGRSMWHAWETREKVLVGKP
jgi:hypothetical protein